MGHRDRRERQRICGRCRSFIDNPEELEADLPGINILGSMYGSVRGDSGFCEHNGRFMRAGDSCEEFRERPKPDA